MGSLEHNQADKLDSSFSRSRSSSGSSVANNNASGEPHCSLGEVIQCLCFVELVCAPQAGSRSTSSTDQPSSSSNQVGQLGLWLGTSQGCVLLINLSMPDSEDNRILQLQSVNAEPIPQAAIKLPGSILRLATFQAAANGGPAKAPPVGGSQSSSTEADLSSNSQLSAGQPAGAPASGQQHQSRAETQLELTKRFLGIVSEKQARIYQLPRIASQNTQKGSSSSTASTSSTADVGKGSKEQPTGAPLEDSPLARLLVQGKSPSWSSSSSASASSSSTASSAAGQSNCCSQTELSETSFVSAANIIQWRQPEEFCLVTYLGTGNVVVYSLPLMRPLYEQDFVPLTSQRIGASMRFSKNGHCLYQPSRGEILKFTLNSHYKSLLNEMLGSLYVAREMPEMPRGSNFFKSLFSVASSMTSRQNERDELFGNEAIAGKPSRGVAKHITNNTGTPSASSSSLSATGYEKLRHTASGSMGHDVRLAREGLDERGEKLSDLEDRTLQMMNQSESYANTAHQLAQKFKDKKWYQF